MENPITEVSAIVEANRKSKRDEAIRDIIHDVEGRSNCNLLLLRVILMNLHIWIGL
ncbi:hypothetical protein KUH03_00610 [Sphingobacterium sp. E70]|uniref:hypothetical protein n=1 Tax=Sphingobacterium sp. E70 TaxID=2853439 RepID=UPI00211C4474|nr:hypothetical protein [Sphingobacterium sp. E70]ULT25552.1 hypothetical protein KUH03_00610 [Sphingobacterium sp. E70]